MWVKKIFSKLHVDALQYPWNKTSKHTDSPVTRKFKQMLSTKKITASVFWDYKWVVFVEFLKRGQIMNVDRYIETLNKVWDKIRWESKQRGRLSTGTIKLLHDNASPHTAKINTGLVEEGKIGGYRVSFSPPWPRSIRFPSVWSVRGALKRDKVCNNIWAAENGSIAVF